MSDYSLSTIGVTAQVAGSAIDPGAGRSVYITAIINGTDSAISDGVALSSSADIILGKQRHGPTGTVKVEFEGIYTKFKDLSKN